MNTNEHNNNHTKAKLKELKKFYSHQLCDSFKGVHTHNLKEAVDKLNAIDEAILCSIDEDYRGGI